MQKSHFSVASYVGATVVIGSVNAQDKDTEAQRERKYMCSTEIGIERKIERERQREKEIQRDKE